MSLSLTVLGCGSSAGVPEIGDYWGKCNPDNPKNRRTRCSVLVDWDGTKILVDTSPDLRNQCLREGIKAVDAVIWTHDHADHCHGIDDLRALSRRMGKAIPSYMDAQTYALLEQRFQYIFQTDRTSNLYRTFTHPTIVTDALELAGHDIRFIYQTHGPEAYSYGLRFGPLAYSTDVSALNDQAIAALQDLEVWVVDCLTWHKHPTHASWEVLQEWLKVIKPQRVYLTHLGANMDWDEVNSKTPDYVTPAYDGLRITV